MLKPKDQIILGLPHCHSHGEGWIEWLMIGFLFVFLGMSLTRACETPTQGEVSDAQP